MAEPAASPAAPKRPAHWDKRVAAAYLRMIGHTQAKAARGVGRAVRTIRDWEKHPTWRDARAEARERWMNDVEDRARARLLADLETKGTGELALKVLERLDDDLKPAKQQHEHSGSLTGVMQVPAGASPADWDAAAPDQQTRVGNGNGHRRGA